MLRSRRLAFAAAALLVGLSACGDDSSQRTVAGNSPAVIQLGAGSWSSTSGGAEAASMDKMMMPMQDITFVFDGDGSAVGSAGSAWTLPTGGTPDAARIEKLAALLGVEGELREVPADQGGGWMIGAADYSTATLMVSTDGMLSWWFNPAPSTAVSSVECIYVDPAIDVVPLDTDAVATTEAEGSTVGGDAAVAPPDSSCVAPLPPANVPDDDAALAKAKQLFADMGYDNSTFDYEVYADEWGANVTAYLLLNGMRSPLSLSVGFGAESAVTWASGSLATPVPAGEYPLVGVEGGVARLNDESGQWGGYWGGPTAVARMESTASVEVAADSSGSDVGSGGVAVSESSTEPVSIDSPVCDPAADCVDEMPELEPVTVTLAGVKMGLTMIWAADNTVWLLPAYEFSADDGGMYTVIAVDDSFIQLPAPYPTDTIPVDTMPIDTVSGETVPAESVPTDSVPVDFEMVDQAAANEALVGLSLDEAVKVAEELGWEVRVSRLDGEEQILTADLRTNRVNVAVVDGAVIGVESVG